jgi:hypothetical protein
VESKWAVSVSELYSLIERITTASSSLLLRGTISTSYNKIGSISNNKKAHQQMLNGLAK